MRCKRFATSLPIFACALAAWPAAAQQAPLVRTGDGLALRLAADGTVAGLTLDKNALPLSPQPAGFHIVEYQPPDGARRDWGVLRGKLTLGRDGLELQCAPAEAGLSFEARFRGLPGRIEVEGVVADTTGKDRALLVSFRLPIAAEGWQWGDNMDRAREIAAGGSYDIDDRLGEKRDIPVSRLPYTAISAERQGVGISLGVPMHEPRVFRLFYDRLGYQVSWQLGLAPEVGKEKARARFRFILYRHAPAWGFRSAMQRYYEFFPELYVKRFPRDGALGFGGRSGYLAPNLEDFAASAIGVGQVTLTPEQAAKYKEHGLVAFKHREPWAWWHRVQFGENKEVRVPSRLAQPGDPPQPSLEEELAIIEKKQREPPEILDGNDQIPGPVREVAAAAERCFIYDENGRPRRLLWHLWSTRDGMAWHSQIPLNANPRLPVPNRSYLARQYQFQNMATWDDPQAPHVNGVSFDSLTNWTGFRWEDYRRENFAYATIPLTFCPRNGRVVQITGFHAWEMVKAWGEEIRSKGRYLMSNTDTQPALFCGRYLDIMAVERSPNVVGEEELALVRALCYRKPAMYYRSVDETGLRKCLLYAVFPTTGVVTSPSEAEAARPLYKKYAPLIRRISTVGWQPITHARARSEGRPLKIERYGDLAKGLYFALRNSGSAPAAAEVLVDTAALGLRSRRIGVRELVEKRDVRQKSEGKTLTITLRLEARETLLLSLEPAQ